MPKNDQPRPNKKHYLRALPFAAPIFIVGFVLGVIETMRGGFDFISPVTTAISLGIVLYLAGRFHQQDLAKNAGTSQKPGPVR